MTLKTILQGEKSDIIICVDWNPTSDTVEIVHYVVSQKGTTCVDITDQFEENLSTFIDKLPWREIANVERIELEN